MRTKRDPIAYLACYLLLKKGGKLLLIRRFNTGYRDGDYTFVSGHLEGGEDVLEAMRREAKEEAGIDIAIKDMRVAHVLHRIANDREYVDFYIEAEKWKGELRNMEPEKCDDMQWFGERSLPYNILPYIPAVIGNVKKNKLFSEYQEYSG